MDLKERIRQVRLRKGLIGSFKEQQEAKKIYRRKIIEYNKNAREMGYAKGIKQAISEDKKLLKSAKKDLKTLKKKSKRVFGV